MQVPTASELWQRAARNPLAASFAISLVVHLFAYGAFKALGPQAFASGKGVLSALVAKLTESVSREKKVVADLNQRKNQELYEEMLRKQEVPLTFVEVDPALAEVEPPKTAKHYSTHNTVAANPTPRKETQQPKIEGAQTKVVRVIDNPKPQPKATPQPLQPSFQPKPQEAPKPAQTASKKPQEQPPQLRPDAKPETKSEPAKPLETVADRTHEKTPAKPDLKPPGGETIGDMAKATPVNTNFLNRVPGTGSPLTANPLIAEPSPPQQQQERPRTLAQARAQKGITAGPVMQQDGGVKRAGPRISVDAKGSLFGVYDAAFIAAVEERWYQLIDSYREKGGMIGKGKVVLDFQLRFDGRITGMAVNDSSVRELQSMLCQRAVLDPAPFARWPSDMRRMIGNDHREVRFTFYYD